MNGTPPPLVGAGTSGPVPPAKNLRAATLLNVMLPGAGLFYLGRRAVGSVLAAGFLTTFMAVLGLFLSGYVRYLSIALGENLLEGDKLEQAGAGFHQSWLLGLAGVGVAIYVLSTVLFQQAKRRFGS